MFNFSGEKYVFAYFSPRLKRFGSVLRFVWFVQLAVTRLSNFPPAAACATDGCSEESN